MTRKRNSSLSRNANAAENIREFAKVKNEKVEQRDVCDTTCRMSRSHERRGARDVRHAYAHYVSPIRTVRQGRPSARACVARASSLRVSGTCGKYGVPGAYAST